MQKAFKWCILATVVASFSTVIACHVLVLVFHSDRTGENLWIQNCLIKKERIARHCTGPKLVFIGGSATLFGVRTKDIQQALRIPVINVAVHAGLNVDYIVHRAKAVLKEGDWVILPLEYDLFVQDGKPSRLSASFLLTYDKQYLYSRPLQRQLDYMRQIDPFILLWSLTHKRPQEQAEPKEAEIGVGYNSDTLNENGDETFNEGNEKALKRAGTFKPFYLPGREFTKSHVLKEISDFSKWCVDRKIHFYVSYANCLYFKQYEEKAYQDYFTQLEAYFRARDIRVLGKPYDFFFDIKYLYDTPYHLNRDGALLRTKRLIHMLTPIVQQQSSRQV